MGAITTTFATTTSLSVLLHGAVVVGWLAMTEPFTVTGQGLQVQLISSSNQTNQAATQTQHRVESQPVQPLIPEHKVANVRQDKLDKQSLKQLKPSEMSPAISPVISPRQKAMFSSDVIAVNTSPILIALTGTPVLTVNTGAKSNVENTKQAVSKNIVTPAQPVLSTNALQQQHSILELLHASISDNKEYPYIARRQRREGIARIGFILNPDGSIQNTRLLTSSSASVLDRAALSAVRSIEPFAPAQDYLEQAEAFEIEVVFQLL